MCDQGFNTCHENSEQEARASSALSQWNTVFSSLQSFPFAPLTGHTFLPEFPTRSTFRRCVTWDKGFLFALHIILCICSIISPREVKALVPDQPVSALLWGSHKRSTLSEHGLTNLFRVTQQQCSHLELVDISSFVKYVICCWPPSPSALEGLTLNSLLNNTLY